MICKICEKDSKSLFNHIQWNHKDFTTKSYYDKFLRKENEGTCYCGKETRFRGFTHGYAKTCGYSCHNKHKKVLNVENYSKATRLKWEKGEFDEVAFGRGKYGKFFSEKNNKEIFYQSSLELAAYKILEQLDVVKKYGRCDFSFKYISPEDNKYHRYKPDILVEYLDGIKQIIEVKSEWNSSNNIVLAKAKAAKEKFKNYTIWTERQIYGEINHG